MAQDKFPLLSKLRAALEEQRALTTTIEQATDQIIPHIFHRGGKPITSFRKAWDRACTKAGFPGLIPHDMRRSAVRNLERAAVPQSTAMKMTGHLTDSVYKRYAIADEAMLREGAEKLAAYHAGASTVTRKVVPITNVRRATG